MLADEHCLGIVCKSLCVLHIEFSVFRKCFGVMIFTSWCPPAVFARPLLGLVLVMYKLWICYLHRYVRIHSESCNNIIITCIISGNKESVQCLFHTCIVCL